MAGSRNSAFSLVELLVVVTIIVLLIAMLAPAMERAIDAGLRAVCASNQHALHAATALYAADNRGRILQTVVLGGPYRLAALARHREGASPVGLYDEFNVLKMAPYTAGVDPNNPDYASRLGKQWFCPSQLSAQEMERQYGFLRHHWANDGNPTGMGVWTSWDHLFLSYAYFARVENVGDRVTRPEDLTGARLGSQSLLFSDTIYWGPYAVWYWMFNHGTEGPGFWTQPIETFAGANQAFADGSVHWKAASQFNVRVMANHIYDSTQTETGMMDGSGGIVSYWWT